ncbi:MAG: hypothetical protein OZSIB_4234 [Candidatus Ozemobacter sibiricus]|uniref:Transmembrane protein n=1 Tax=Candidatus Ozemobacter sibiricus TaxID=2268124 RepID=A0A367ZN56_9BACT|nr:MAG: hypothetical protein OZSIB_4234 [Candidatus Ozemobacter sibiricus]
MGLLAFLKGMKADEPGPGTVILRTSRTCGAFGVMVLLAGVGVAGRAAIYLLQGGGLAVTALGMIVAGGLGVGGLMVLTYRKCVIISRKQSKIEYMEFGVLCEKRATYHFRDLLHLELCRSCECLGASPVSLWRIKAYVRRGGGFEAVCLFESHRSEEVQDQAQRLSSWIGTPVFQKEVPAGWTSFTSQVGH